jgi:hypothetical protein
VHCPGIHLGVTETCLTARQGYGATDKSSPTFRLRRNCELRALLAARGTFHRARLSGVGERSGIRYHRVVPRISWLLMRGFFWRLREKYVIRDFHPLVFFYGFGFVATLAGLILGFVERGFRAAGNSVSVGTVVLVALLIISGSQLTLFAMWFDMESNKDLR